MTKLLCVEPRYSLFGNKELISKGKIYKMIRETSSHYMVIANDEKLREFYKHRFQVLECKSCTYRKCNSCPVDKEK